MNYVNFMVQIQMQSLDYKKGKKKIVNGLFGLNDLNENANNHLCSLNM